MSGVAPASKSAAGATGPALAALRRATSRKHDEIEALLQLAPAGDGAPFTLGLDRYAAVLQGLDSFLSAWEPRLLAALPKALRDGFRARSRHAFLRQDLQALSAHLPTRPQAPGGDGAVLALVLPDKAAALGSMYVLEGSALGGQAIARALRQCPGLDAMRGTRYFMGHGADTGRMWREFRDLLSRELDEDPVAIQGACRAAIDTFDALIACFREIPAAARR